MKTDTTKYPNITFVADQLDMTLLADLSGGDDDEPPTERVYALGSRADMDAGLFQVEVTPYFNSLEQLENFCRVHRSKFEALAEQESWPEKFFWESEAAAC